MSEDIIRMAEEAGLPLAWVSAKGVIQWAQLERFAALVAADEREACAKVCVADLIESPTKFEVAAINKCAAAIRARKP